jgi:indolepyruvate ferredoxin oxidoreductase beta subunit
MKKDIIFAGVGGQGIVSAAAMVVSCADRLGFKCKQNEVHGMAQRGGAVVCHVRISDEEIYSDIIPRGGADIILATEPMEAIRYLDFLKKGGKIISCNRPVINIEYPDLQNVIDAIKKHSGSVIVDAKKLVAELKNERVVNIAMVGALCKVLDLDGLKEGILKDVEKRFSKKGEAVVKLNFQAFEFGQTSA